MKDQRRTILFLSDHPLVPSGVGTQAKYLIEGLLETGKYRFICLGGAIKHPDYRAQQVAPEKFGEGNWIIHPVDGHGNKEIVRKILAHEKPDAMVIFTDPRFFYWVWEFEDEIRQVCPLLYWHVWDNDPTPDFNKTFYESTDFISALSLKTYGILQGLGYPKNRFNYIPHAIHHELFKPLDDDEVKMFQKNNYGPHGDKKFVVFWNNRNARRKMTGDVIETFAMALKEIGKKNAVLMMHTAVKDPEGQDIVALARKFDIDTNLIVSEDRIEPSALNWFYNVADVTINIANNEGFGLGTLESLFAGTPVIVNFTGGLQFQIGDWWNGRTDFTDQEEMTTLAKKMWNKKQGNWWGIPIFPTSRACVGSQQVPYIYDDRFDSKQVAAALVSMYKMGRAKRKELGLRARSWALENFNIASMIDSWDKTLSSQIEKHRTSGRPKYVQVDL